MRSWKDEHSAQTHEENPHTATICNRHRVLVREIVPKRLDSHTTCSLDPLTPWSLRGRVSHDGSYALILAADSERFVACAEGRPKRGNVRVELHERRDVLFEDRRGFDERVILNGEELNNLIVCGQGGWGEEGA